MNSEDYLLRRDLAPLKKRRFWYVLSVALCLIGLIIPQSLVFLAGLFILVIGIMPEIWYRVALRHLEIHQQLDQNSSFFWRGGNTHTAFREPEMAASHVVEG